MKDLGVLREAARDITQELGIELKVIKIHRETDDAQGHHKNIPPKSIKRHQSVPQK
ncbi:hypothetical protein [Candidatus Williamhamiltonella defendens]|uniref:hypothetical protein n=1 Tax=Candidatus Williamhamiltonella defendens TaxID=138072 RepID=UPI001F369882|nr:hypothetical protein [Candidatus Hamiltonella defensa]